ncbi:glycosyltransferase [bacterium]|nr:glycosyltransferase [bacterium]
MATSNHRNELPVTMPPQSPVRVGYAVSDARTVRAFLRFQIGDLKAHGLEPNVFCGGNHSPSDQGELGRITPIPFSREMKPLADLRALLALLGSREFRSLDVLNASTPKAGLLGMLAGWMCRIPARIYLVRGLRYETATGWKRWLLMTAEKLACASAHRVVCISESVRRELISHGLVAASKTCILESGSSNGVNFARFADVPMTRVNALRDELRIPADAPVIGFVGRLTRDKGIAELWSAFQQIRQRWPAARLLIVGDFEAGDPVASEVQTALRHDPAVHITGFVSDTSPYFHLMSLLAFPSYREGFPNVILEASCAGIPTVGFSATGTIDAIVDGQTGRIVPLPDINRLAEAINLYLADDLLRQRHGLAARERALRDFNPERISRAMYALYDELLRSHTGRGLPVIEDEALPAAA